LYKKKMIYRYKIDYFEHNIGIKMLKFYSFKTKNKRNFFFRDGKSDFIL
jgi:hypothetical protein